MPSATCCIGMSAPPTPPRRDEAGEVADTYWQDQCKMMYTRYNPEKLKDFDVIFTKYKIKTTMIIKQRAAPDIRASQVSQAVQHSGSSCSSSEGEKSKLV